MATAPWWLSVLLGAILCLDGAPDFGHPDAPPDTVPCVQGGDRRSLYRRYGGDADAWAGAATIDIASNLPPTNEVTSLIGSAVGNGQKRALRFTLPAGKECRLAAAVLRLLVSSGGSLPAVTIRSQKSSDPAANILDTFTTSDAVAEGSVAAYTYSAGDPARVYGNGTAFEVQIEAAGTAAATWSSSSPTKNFAGVATLAANYRWASTGWIVVLTKNSLSLTGTCRDV
ncbi:hypothetical protein DFJ74DRAFT_771658 [Hyaloraphidium curvatum]|nr:hypothetical protein DFJ74DRAFT_771658 [Hyaloraphidium curvatum]